MTRADLLKLLILGEIADDYEGLDHIASHVITRAQLCGLSVSPEEVHGLLTDVLRSGFASAYDVSVDPPVQVSAKEVIGHLQGYYFWATEEGKRWFRSSWAEWPFDEEGQLVSGWSAPDGWRTRS
jgi:hypothetical protein